MTATERDTAVGVFADRTHAEMALDELHRHGFTADQIGVVIPDGSEKVEVPAVDTDQEALVWEGAVAGAGTGVALGGLLGAALTMAALPGVGAAIVGGLLAGGAAGGGVVGALIGLNVPEEEAHHYEREFHSGRTLVTVRAGPQRYEEAVEILRRVAELPEPWGPRQEGGRLSRLADEDKRPTGGGAVVPAP
jgi:hypothetical protein